jgi:hypothetical protein
MTATDRRRAQAKPSTKGVNRLRQPRADRRRAQAKPSTKGVNRLRQPRPGLAHHVPGLKQMGGI